MNHLSISGLYSFQHLRDGKIIDEWDQPNIIVDQGLDTILNCSIGPGYNRNLSANPLTCYVSLFKNDYTPVAGDTYATFANVGVAGEITTSDVDQLIRQVWVPTFFFNSYTLGSNASPVTYTFKANTDVYGAFLLKNWTSTITGDKITTAFGDTGTPPLATATIPEYTRHQGGLISAAKFPAVRNMLTGDAITVVYSISLTSS